MATAVYVEDGDCFKHFVCFVPETDDKKCVFVDKKTVECKAFNNVDCVETVSFSECTCIKMSAFEDCKELKMVVWNGDENNDSTLLTNYTVATVDNISIQYKAFKNCAKLQAVVLPKVNGKITIEKEAFAGCGELRTVVFGNAKDVDISEEAFIGCAKVTFVCASDSAAERYAREHGFRIVNF